ncbi:MAG: glycosyltransferase family 39 protein [Chloroflexota bacterium]
MSERRILLLILAAFVLLGITYAVTTPVFEASDELWHYPMVRHLAQGNPLPVQVFDPAQAGPWKQEASQPPLYYYVGAALTFWIDTMDIPLVRRLNPHVDNGVVTADGNVNLVVHDPEQSPWQGALLAVRIIRVASVLMGTVTVYLTYRLARAVAPRRPEIALGAAAINAFTPMFLFISGAVNNDNLAIMLASLALWMMVRVVHRNRQNGSDTNGLGQWLLLGVVIGLAALTKEGALGLIPMALGTAAIAAWQRMDVSPVTGNVVERVKGVSALMWLTTRTAVRFTVTLIPVLVIAGWWYYRNIILYGDWLGWNAFVAVLGQRPQPATLAQLWDERWGFLASYWGLFGGVNVPMPDWIYAVFNGLLLLAVPGFIFYAWKALTRWRNSRAGSEAGRARRLPGVLDALFQFVATNFALVVCLLFSAAVIYGLINWSTTTWSSQGRLAFSAISALSTLLALGLFGWLPYRAASLASGAIGIFFFGVAALAPFLWIAPAYEPEPAAVPVALQPVEADFAGRLALTGYAIDTEDGGEQVHPGEMVDVYLEWQVLAPMVRDWSVFVHLNDPVLETPIAQRDMYPGGGLLATTFLEPGTTLREFYRLQTPETAVAPAELELVVGLYDYETNQRLRADQGDAVVLDTLALRRATDEARTMSVNFGRELTLVDFQIAPRRVAAGEEIVLTASWEARRELDHDYTLFAQVLNDKDTTRWAAVDIGVETSSWEPGTIQEVQMPMTVNAEAPAGVYTVIVGAYTRGETGSFDRLQIVRDGRITMDDVIQLTRIRIE